MFECRTRNREETWLPVDTNSESRKVSSPDLPIRMIQSLIQNERASWTTSFFFFFFPMGTVQYDPMFGG